jgi:SAM-dependent methyltransferase
LKPTGERRTPASARSTEDRVQDALHLFPYHFVRRFVSPKTRMLDLGFGEGYGAEILSPTVGEYVGLDVSEEAVRHASASYRLPNVRFERSDGRTIAFPSSTFDLIVSFHLLEHLSDTDPYFEEMARVCRVGGRIVIVTPNRAFRLGEGERPWNRFHVREYDQTELAEALSRTFTQFTVMGIAGSEAMNAVERSRVERARRWARLDPLGLRYRLPETVMVRIRRSLGAVRRGKDVWSAAEFSVADVRCAEAELDRAVHLLAVIDRVA